MLADGHIQYETLRGQRLTESELRQVVRMHGIGDLSQVKAVILESNGEFSVITTSQYGDGSATAGLDLV
ncbi:MAG: YetF domain-containing protein [Yaniella sp.]|uniref:YetF domain-containing protein n=1 Tax=Yaniella sp. TaxID=2773929 RepID=UPI003F956CDF